MKAHISRLLESMENDVQREELRSWMELLFLPIYEETLQKYDALEKRLQEELPCDTSNFSVCGTVARTENARQCAWMFPVLPADLEKENVTAKQLKMGMQSEKEIVLESVFLEADYLTCMEISNSSYRASCVGENYRVPLRVRLRPSLRYQACVEQLYRYFLANGIPWTTIHHPYLSKFYDVICVQMDAIEQDLPDMEAQVEIDFQQHSTVIKRGLIPIWNIEHLTAKSRDFPVPAIDKVNYEYYFPLNAEAAQDGYLMEYGSESISAMRREKDQLVITAPTKSDLRWNMLRLYQRSPSATEQFLYPIFDNRQAESFSGRMVSHYGTVVKTKAELFRIVQSYSTSSMLKLHNYYIAKERILTETWEANAFIKDEIRDVNASHTLVLQFEPCRKGYFLNRDIMSFLTSQVQLIYPEYHCAGVLV